MSSSSPNLKRPHVRCPICAEAVDVDPFLAAAEAVCRACQSPFWFRRDDDDPETRTTLPVLSLSIPAGASSTDVICAAVRLLATLGQIPAEKEQEIREAVLEREELGSTGIGNGFAIPHTSRGNVEHPVVAIMRLSSGVPFGGLDPRPAQIIGMAICPAGRPDEYLGSLELISDYLHSQLSGDADDL